MHVLIDNKKLYTMSTKYDIKLMTNYYCGKGMHVVDSIMNNYCTV